MNALTQSKSNVFVNFVMNFLFKVVLIIKFTIIQYVVQYIVKHFCKLFIMWNIINLTVKCDTFIVKLVLWFVKQVICNVVKQ